MNKKIDKENLNDQNKGKGVIRKKATSMLDH
jgi:hypothetical protein